MQKPHSIHSALSLATSLLLTSGCSSEDSGNTITNAVENLVGTWTTVCKGLTSNGTVTFTTASGGSATTSTNETIISSIKSTYTFDASNQELIIRDEEFADTASCDPATSMGSNIVSVGPYETLLDVTANDGQAAVQLNYMAYSNNVFTLYRIYDNTILFFGGRDASSLSSVDGSSEFLRYDGINYNNEFNKL